MLHYTHTDTFLSLAHCSQAMVFHTQELHTEPGTHTQDGSKESVFIRESWGQGSGW